MHILKSGLKSKWPNIVVWSVYDGALPSPSLLEVVVDWLWAGLGASHSINVSPASVINHLLEKWRFRPTLEGVFLRPLSRIHPVIFLANSCVGERGVTTYTGSSRPVMEQWGYMGIVMNFFVILLHSISS